MTKYCASNPPRTKRTKIKNVKIVLKHNNNAVLRLIKPLYETQNEIYKSCING